MPKRRTCDVTGTNRSHPRPFSATATSPEVHEDHLTVTRIDSSQKGMRMLTRSAAVWAAVSGLVGTCMLGISFAINTGPPSSTSVAQLTAFGQQHHDAILWGAWLQAVGPAFIAVFALAIVVLAGATARLAGWMTLFGAATLMTVSLIEITGYISTLHTSPATMPETSLALIYSVQHLWFIIGAPALWLPLGLVIFGSHVLPRILGYLALALAAGYVLAGVFTLFDPTVPAAVQISAGVLPALWWLAATGTLIIRARQAPSAARLPANAAAGHGMAGRV
jgi:hypothetical protein